MGWQLIQAADLPAAPNSTDSQSVIVTLIFALGPVLVALIGGWATVRSARTSASPPIPDPLLGERVTQVDERLAHVEVHDRDDRRTLAQLDRHVDGISDRVVDHGERLAGHEERLRAQDERIDRLEAWMDQVRQPWRPPQ